RLLGCFAPRARSSGESPLPTGRTGPRRVAERAPPITRVKEPCMRKLESILVASDLTEGSDEVVRAAASIAARTNARLHALHAFDFQALPYSEERLARVTFADRIDEAKRALREQVRRTSPPGVDVASEEVVIYIAHKAIRDRAEAVDADLIVMGPHRPLPV